MARATSKASQARETALRAAAGRKRELDLQALPEGDGRYMMINMLARRARYLNREHGQNQLDDSGMFDAISFALSEYRSSKIKAVLGELQPTGTEDFRSVEG